MFSRAAAVALTFSAILAIPLIGAMDAVVEENGAPAVWELKTAAKRWSSDQLEYDLQPTTYQIAARSRGHDAQVKLIVTTKGKSPVVQVEKLVRHRGDERELAEVVFGVHRAIAAGVDHPARGWQCRSCPYAGACGA